jgi:hypothetical protein
MSTEKTDNELKLVKKKRTDLVKRLLYWGVVFFGIGFYIVSTMMPVVPPGNVLNAGFLNTLKYLVLFKFVFLLLSVIMLLVFAFKSDRIKDADKRKYLLILIFVFIAACILSTKGRFSFSGVVSAFTDTPQVAVKTLTDKSVGTGRFKSTHTVYFDDGSFGHVSYYDYHSLVIGSELYVVYCDREVIGVFPKDKYVLEK